MKTKYLVLDAMGVIYKYCDDVEELLIPFIRSNGSNIAKDKIKDYYKKASLGKLSSKLFWKSVGLSPEIENEYLHSFILTKGIISFLSKATNRFEKIVCLSNDVSEWSNKLRRHFKLSTYIKEWFISGELKCRKPSIEIYYKLLAGLNGIKSDEITFIDDKEENLIPARNIGLNVILFTGNYNKFEKNTSIEQEICIIDELDKLFSVIK